MTSPKMDITLFIWSLGVHLGAYTLLAYGSAIKKAALLAVS